MFLYIYILYDAIKNAREEKLVLPTNYELQLQFLLTVNVSRNFVICPVLERFTIVMNLIFHANICIHIYAGRKKKHGK